MLLFAFGKDIASQFFLLFLLRRTNSFSPIFVPDSDKSSTANFPYHHHLSDKVILHNCNHMKKLVIYSINGNRLDNSKLCLLFIVFA